MSIGYIGADAIGHGGARAPHFWKVEGTGGTVSPSLRRIRWLLYTYNNADHDKKPILCLKESAKTHVEQSRISKIFPIPLIQRIMHLARQKVKVKRCVVKKCEWQERGVWWGFTRMWLEERSDKKEERIDVYIYRLKVQCTGVTMSSRENCEQSS